MATNTAQPTARKRPRTGGRSNRAVKRATYTVGSQSRVLFTVSSDGVSKLIDAPAELYDIAATGLATPDTFIVEPQADGDAQELEAIINDYLEQSVLHARVPMSFSRLGDFLKALAA
jgi:hypothetical protein